VRLAQEHHLAAILGFGLQFRSAPSDQVLVEVRQPGLILRLRPAAPIHNGEERDQRTAVILPGVQCQAVIQGGEVDLLRSECDEGEEENDR